MRRPERDAEFLSSLEAGHGRSDGRKNGGLFEWKSLVADISRLTALVEKHYSASISRFLFGCASSSATVPANAPIGTPWAQRWQFSSRWNVRNPSKVRRRPETTTHLFEIQNGELEKRCIFRGSNLHRSLQVFYCRIQPWGLYGSADIRGIA